MIVKIIHNYRPCDEYNMKDLLYNLSVCKRHGIHDLLNEPFK